MSVFSQKTIITTNSLTVSTVFDVRMRETADLSDQMENSLQWCDSQNFNHGNNAYCFVCLCATIKGTYCKWSRLDRRRLVVSFEVYW